MHVNSIKKGVKASIGILSDFGVDYINIPWSASGDNLLSCELEWRKAGDAKWNNILGECGVLNRTCLNDLQPKTIYEIRIKTISKAGDVLYTDIETPATYFASTGSADDSHEINNVDDLRTFASMVAYGENFGGKVIRLNTDIDLEGRKGVLWEPIMSKYYKDCFEGEFDGNGHVIYDMKINSMRPAVGFMANVHGYIHDLTFRNANIHIGKTKAALANYMGGAGVIYAGVGGIAGEISSNTIYDIAVERCGFEGTIIVEGAKSVGGIVGRSSGLAFDYKTLEPIVKDCYANTKIKFTNEEIYAPIGGIIGQGAAVDCYFTGLIETPVECKYVGPITGFKQSEQSENDYYREGSCDLNTKGIGASMSESEMKSKSFLTKLTDNIWELGGQQNDGYPVLFYSTKGKANTGEAKHDNNGDVVLKGLYRPGANGIHDIFGFEYFNNSAEQLVLNNVNAISDSLSFAVTIPNSEVPRTGVEYRAYVTNAEKDTLFGEWVRFYPSIIKPKALLIDAKCKGTALAFNYFIDAGTEEVVEAFVVSTPKAKGATLKHDLQADEYELKTKHMGNVGDSYTSYVEIHTKSGIIERSEPIEWTMEEALLGDANVDFRLSVADVTTTLNYILELMPKYFHYDNADANNDGNITVTDATLITNMVLGTSYAAQPNHGGGNMDAAPSYLQLHMDDLCLEKGEPETMAVSLIGADGFVAAQFDVRLPQGVRIVEAKAQGGHTALWKQMEDGSYRLMVYSMSNDSFISDDIVTLTFMANGNATNGEIRFQNIFVDALSGSDIRETMLAESTAGFVYRNTTGIEDINSATDEGKTDRLYNLNGQRIQIPQRGLYIKNGKKVSLK